MSREEMAVWVRSECACVDLASTCAFLREVSVFLLGTRWQPSPCAVSESIWIGEDRGVWVESTSLPRCCFPRTGENVSWCLKPPSCPSVLGPGLRLEKQNWGTVPIALSQLEVPWAAPALIPTGTGLRGGLDSSWGKKHKKTDPAARG